MRFRQKGDGERGAALLEFVVLGVCVLLPLVYVVLAVMKVQAASFGVTEAARQAGRAFAQADTAANGSDRANLAARLALQDQGISVDEAQVTINCDVGMCLSPGSSTTVLVATRISLPFVPDVWSDSSMASIEVSGEYRADIEALRAAS